MKTKTPLHRIAALFALALLATFGATHEAKAQYQVTTLGTAVVENFNGMQVPTGTITAINFNAALGTTNQTQRNSAWVLQSGTGVGNGTGTAATGGYYAFADANGTDKALGY